MGLRSMKQNRVARVFSVLISIAMVLNMVPAPALAEALTELQVDGSSQSVGLEEVLQTTEAKGAVTESEPESGSAMPAFEGSQEVVGATVTVKAPDGAFPAEATLQVAEAVEAMPDEPERERIAQAVKVARAPRTEDVQHDQEAQTKTDSASEDAEDKAAPQPKPNVATTHTLRIQVLDGNGNELQPAGDQRAEVIFSLAEATDKNLTASVYHVSSKAKGEYEAELVAKRKVSITDEEKGTVSFKAADLSSWYVVEFGYDDLRFELVVDGEVALADVLEAVGLSGEADAVRTEGDEALYAYGEDGAWVVAADQELTAEAWIVVTIAGREYRIAVTTPSADDVDGSGDADNIGEQESGDQGTSEEGDVPAGQDGQTNASQDASQQGEASGEQADAIDEEGPKGEDASDDQADAGDKDADESGARAKEGDEGAADGKTLLQKLGLQQPTAAPAPGDAMLLFTQAEEVVDSFGTASGGKYVLQDGKTYKLTKDFSLGGNYIEVPKEATVTIDFGGFTLKREVSKLTSYAVIENKGSLTLKNGTVTGGWAHNGGGLFNASSGVMDLEGVTVTGNKAYVRGGGIDNRGGSLRMKDCEVAGNSLTTTSAADALTGGGIYSTGSLAVSGRVVVANNGVSNLYLDAGRVLGVDGALDSSSNIGIGTEATGYPRYLTSGLVASGNKSISMFTLENAPEGITAILAGGELYAKKPADKTIKSWSDLQTALNAATDGQIIELDDNIRAADGDIRLDVKPNKNVVIDLAGHTLDRGLADKGAQSGSGHVIWVESGATLTIRDSGGRGRITGGNANGNGGGIIVAGTLNVEGGAITGNKATGNGGGIMVNGGATLKMAYGSVTKNSCGAYGGGICADGTVSLSNCTIATNTGKHGGGINVNHSGKTSTFTDVTFDGNTSTTQGGAMYQWKGAVEITRGSVVHNVSEDCGGIFVKDDSNKLIATGTLFDDNRSTRHSGGAIVNYRTLQLKDCTFTNNRAYNNGGAIWNCGGTCNTTIEDCTFSKNNALEKGGAIYLETGATVSIDGGTYTQNYAERYGGGIHIATNANDMRVKGAPVVKDNKTSGTGKNVYIGKGRKLNVNGALVDGASVGFIMADQEGNNDPNITFTTGFATHNAADDDPADYFFYDASNIAVYKDDNGEARIGASSWQDLQAQINAANDGDTITLEKDYTAGVNDKDLLVKKSLTLDLNGHTLNRSCSSLSSVGAVITVGKDRTQSTKDYVLTIKDSKGGGLITGANAYAVYVYSRYDDRKGATLNFEGGTIANNQGGGINLSDYTTLNMSGGVIENNSSKHSGCGICAYEYSVINLTGGKIEGNKGAYVGGGIYTAGTLTMSGGEILSNSANGRGGGLYVQGSATITGGRIAYNSSDDDGGGIYDACGITLTGGTITGNKASDKGGGMSVEKGKELKIKDAPVVTGNRASVGDEMFLSPQEGAIKPIKVIGRLTSDVSMGVQLNYGGFGTFTTGFAENNPGALPNTFFHSTDPTFEVITDANGEAAMQGGWTLLQEQINKANDGDTITLTKGYRANEPETTLVIPDNKKLTIDLNGHVISRGLALTQSECLDPKDDTGHVFIVGEGADLTITDASVSDESPTGNGLITGGMAKHGGGINVKKNGKLTLKGGNVAGNMAFEGGGIYLNGSAEFNLEGGAVKANKAHGKSTTPNGVLTELSYGGGVHVHDGARMTMSGGTVDGNYARWEAGAIFVGKDASMTMEGGTLRNNTAGFGGAIDTSGTVRITGGEISSNTASQAGAIYVSGSVTTITGGVIKNNHAKWRCGAIYGGGYGLHLSGGVIEGNTSEFEAGGIKAYGLFVSGNPVVKGNSAPQANNILLADGEGSTNYIVIEGAGLGGNAQLDFLAQSIPRRVTSGLNAKDGAAKRAALRQLTYDGGSPNLTVRDGELYVDVQADKWVSSWKELQQAISNSTPGQVIGLKNNIEAQDGDTRLAVNNNKNVVIELSGRTIDRKLYRQDTWDGYREDGYSEGGGHVIWVEKGGTLTLRDASGGLGTITGGNAKRGGGLNVSGTLNLEGGTIKVNHSKEVGGGICLNSSGTLNATGGIIMSNKTDGPGGGLCLDGKATLSNCRVTGNEAKDGGGIYANMRSNALTMNGVAVEGNKANGAGGGVYLQSGTMQADRSTFNGNTSPDGGGMYITENTKLVARESQFSNNKVTKLSGGGFVNSYGTVELTHCTVSGNQAHGSGGGIYTSGKTDLTGCTLSENLSYDVGGGAMVNNKGKLILFDASIEGNDASGKGGGIYMSGSASSVRMQRNVSVANNDGGDVYLASGKKLTISGPLVVTSPIGVVLEKAEGVFTNGFGTYEGDADPAGFFKSSYGYEVYRKGDEAAVHIQFSADDDKDDFVKRPDQVSETLATMGASWMGGISGDRYLNEINIPYTHDSSMKEAYAWVGSSIGSALGFDKSAQTQYLYIDEQLDAGVRVLDLRLSNYYNDHDWYDEVAFWGSSVFDVTQFLGGTITYGISDPITLLANPTLISLAYGKSNHCTSDDGTNLWMCHGKNSLAGIFWGEDHDGDQLNFKQVIRWAEDFLRQHPSETIVFNCAAEVPDDDDDYKKIVYQRLRDHVKAIYSDTNPSTGKPYLYMEEGSDSPFVSPTRMPQLKECRGQIIIMGGGGEVHGLTLDAGGLRKISDGTSNSVPAEQKIEQLKAFFERTADLKLPTNANEHMDFIMQPDTNSKADSFDDILDSNMRPLNIASKVHLAFFGEDKVYGNPDNLGRYFGWVKMDGATARDAAYIYLSNFFDGLDYVTVTAKPTADAFPSETKTYKLLRYTDITIPECPYEDPDPNKGSFLYWMAVDSKGNMVAYEPKDAYEVADDVTFIAQWDNDKTAQAKVYEVFQNPDGSWEEPEEASARAYSAYTPATHEHFTVSGYSTEFMDGEQGRTALRPGAAINIEEGKTKLYVYYTRNSYDLVYFEDMAGTKVAKTVKVPYEADLDDYADEYLTKDGCIFAGWSTTPKTDGELYYYEDTIPDSWKDEEVAKEHPCVLYRFGDTMPARTLNLYPVFRAEAEEPTFRTHSLILDGSIGVNFFMELPKMAQIDYSTSYMEFSVSGRGGTTTTDPFDAEYTNRLHSYYGFTCYVSSIQMADTITATFHYTVDGENLQVSQEYSIAQYVSDFNKISADYDQVTRDLIFSLADFGHYTQPYLSGIHGWSIGDDYESMPEHAALTADMVEEARSASATYAVTASIPAGGEVKAVSMGLDLETNTTMRLYVSTKDDAGIKSCALADGTPLSVEQTSDGRWVVSVSGIMAHELDKAYDVRITTTGGTNVRMVVSALSFAWAVFGSDAHKDDLDAQYLATALWRYWRCADNYIKA